MYRAPACVNMSVGIATECGSCWGVATVDVLCLFSA